MDGVRLLATEYIDDGPSCPGDVDGNGSVEFTDLVSLLSAWAAGKDVLRMSMDQASIQHDWIVSLSDLAHKQIPAQLIVESSPRIRRGLLRTHPGSDLDHPNGGLGSLNWLTRSSSR